MNKDKVLEQYEMKYEDDNITVKSMKRKPMFVKCEHCDSEVDISKQKIDHRKTYVGTSIRCNICNRFKNPHSGAFDWARSDWQNYYNANIKKSRQNSKD